jgi:uncharacterized protein YceH (UPF0502 family)
MQLELDFAERRVLGVLLEKGFTTPEQYPLTLNYLINGCNQKSCRDPMSHLGEEEVMRSLETLREKGLVTVVRSTSGRTDRFRHRCADTLELEARASSVLAELLLRGPQTDGELRQRASRMVEIPTLADLANTLDQLRLHDPRLVVRASPDGRRRGVKYAHTLYPANETPTEVEDVPAFTASPTGHVAPAPVPQAAGAAPSYASSSPSLPSSMPTATVAASADTSALRAELTRTTERIASLESRVEELESTFMRFFQ